MAAPRIPALPGTTRRSRYRMVARPPCTLFVLFVASGVLGLDSQRRPVKPPASLIRLRQQPASDGVDRRLGAVARPELLKEEREIVLDGTLRQVQLAGDLLVALAVHEHP